MKLKIIATNTDRPKAEVFLNDEKLKGVMAVDVRLAADEVYTATVTFCPTDIKIEGDVEVWKKQMKRDGGK